MVDVDLEGLMDGLTAKLRRAVCHVAFSVLFGLVHP